MKKFSALSKKNDLLFPTVIVITIVICLMIIMLVLLQANISRIKSIDTLENSRGYCEISINELSDASDYMTAQVQEYSIDNNWDHVLNYWNEADNVRTRDKAVEKLLHSDLTDQEKTHVLRAKSYSDDLMTGETWAFKMLAECNGVPEDRLPAEVRSLQLSEKDQELTKSEKETKVRAYLFGTEYSESKADIKSMIHAFNSDLALRLESTTARSFKANHHTIMITWLLFGIMLVLIMAMFVAHSRSAINKNLKLEAALKEAEAANEAKSYFTSRMSHEIRTPLNAVIGYLMLASDSENNEEIHDNIQKSRKAAGNLLSIINDVLDYSAIESHKMSIIAKPFSISRTIKDVEIIYASLAERKGLKYTVRNDEMEHDIIIGDSMRTNQILNNLISNAIKFTPENGHIELKASEVVKDGTAYVTYTVSDDGIGISEDFLPYVFEPYEQQADVISPEFKGTGLGMSIVKTLTEMMGGSVSVQSEQGKGTVFTVELPYEIPAVESPVPVDDHEHKASPDHDLTGLNILLVEDNAMNREIAKNTLQHAGASVTTASDGLEAVTIFEKSEIHDFDLILMDIIMPVMGGYEATKKIRGMSREDSSLPIMAMTANAFSSDIQKSEDAGMDAHIAKPFDRNVMFETILSVCKK